MTDLLKQKDIKIAHNLYLKINKNKKLFLELLNDILDLATLIPVCVAEYCCAEFNSFDVNTLILNEIDSVFKEYGLAIGKLS
ncbi:MAG: hypothetical protein LUI60_05385 [Clostridia bacterium]|nr:hypothetical protein [Clostridia bacterium]